MQFKINYEIRTQKILRVIDAEGQQLGLMYFREAMDKAKEEGLDLVEIAPNADPVVCKIIDYGKCLYDQKKKEKDAKKHQVQIKIKEIKFKPAIDSHDLGIKARQAKDFLGEGDKVKVTCTLRGRDLSNPSLAVNVMNQFMALLENTAIIESPAKFLGRFYGLVLAPAPKKKISGTNEKSEKPAAEKAPVEQK